MFNVYFLSFCDINLAPYLSIARTRVEQGERKPSLLEFAEPQPTLAMHFPKCIAKVVIYFELCKHIFNPKPVMERYGTLWAHIPIILPFFFGNLAVF